MNFKIKEPHNLRGSFCSPTWIRTKTDSTKNCSATVTPSDCFPS